MLLAHGRRLQTKRTRCACCYHTAVWLPAVAVAVAALYCKLPATGCGGVFVMPGATAVRAQTYALICLTSCCVSLSAHVICALSCCRVYCMQVLALVTQVSAKQAQLQALSLENLAPRGQGTCTGAAGQVSRYARLLLLLLPSQTLADLFALDIPVLCVFRGKIQNTHR